MVQCGLVGRYQSSGGLYYLRLQGRTPHHIPEYRTPYYNLFNDFKYVVKPFDLISVHAARNERSIRYIVQYSYTSWIIIIIIIIIITVIVNIISPLPLKMKIK